MLISILLNYDLQNHLSNDHQEFYSLCIKARQIHCNKGIGFAHACRTLQISSVFVIFQLSDVWKLTANCDNRYRINDKNGILQSHNIFSHSFYYSSHKPDSLFEFL